MIDKEPEESSKEVEVEKAVNDHTEEGIAENADNPASAPNPEDTETNQ